MGYRIYKSNVQDLMKPIVAYIIIIKQNDEIRYNPDHKNVTFKIST